MKMIQANCRVQFTAQDIEFILSVLGPKAGTSETLVQLLGDEDTRDLILDDPALLHALLQRHDCLRVSARFYFYILLRQTFLRSDIQDREVADYVAELLAEFAQADRLRCRLPGEAQSLDYFFEMVAALERADDSTRFLLRMHIGNQSLFLTGVFADRIRYRAGKRGFPDVHYYEGLGKASFRLASDHRLAQRFKLASIFNTLADRFGDTRLALNDVVERLFALGDADRSLDALLIGGGQPGGEESSC